MEIRFYRRTVIHFLGSEVKINPQWGDKNPFFLVLRIEAAVGLTLREVLRLDGFVRKFVAELMGGGSKKVNQL
jgi:hypothetical protein